MKPSKVTKEDKHRILRLIVRHHPGRTGREIELLVLKNKTISFSERASLGYIEIMRRLNECVSKGGLSECSILKKNVSTWHVGAVK